MDIIYWYFPIVLPFSILFWKHQTLEEIPYRIQHICTTVKIFATTVISACSGKTNLTVLLLSSIFCTYLHCMMWDCGYVLVCIRARVHITRSMIYGTAIDGSSWLAACIRMLTIQFYIHTFNGVDMGSLDRFCIAQFPIWKSILIYYSKTELNIYHLLFNYLQALFLILH